MKTRLEGRTAFPKINQLPAGPGVVHDIPWFDIQVQQLLLMHGGQRSMELLGQHDPMIVKQRSRLL